MDVSRRSFLELAAISAVTRLAPAVSTATAEKPPNIFFMLGDDHRWDALGCMGNSIIRTPHLDRLAQDGTIFDNHFCTTSICCASRASIMLGQYAGTNGIYDFDTPLSAEQVKQTYWYQLKQAGYHIGFVGKFGVGNTMPNDDFDYWKGFSGQGHYFPQGPSGPHLTDIMRDQANQFFEQAPRDKPFCLSISFKAPHVQDEDPLQYLPSADTLSLYEGLNIPPLARAGADDIRRFPIAIQRSESRRRWGVRFSTPDLYQASTKGYYALVSGIDSAVGSMRETLAKFGLADNTIIIYSADHGIFNGEHGLAGKWYAHEESIRIPLIIHDPRLPENFRGKRRQTMTLNIDLNPTIVKMAGLKNSESTQGRSLVEFEEDEPAGRSIWFFEHHFPYQGWIPSSEGIRTRRWKYVRYMEDASSYEELYDLEHDKFETNNLIGDAQYAHQQRTLTAYWRRWRESLHERTGSWVEPINENDLKRDGLT